MSQTVRGKYKNVRSNGYDSKREERRGGDLTLLERAGEISDLQYHPRWLLIPKQEGERAVEYEADFSYKDKTGKLIVEDVKSAMTRKLPAYILKRKLMLWRHGIRIQEV